MTRADKVLVILPRYLFGIPGLFALVAVVMPGLPVGALLFLLARPVHKPRK